MYSRNDVHLGDWVETDIGNLTQIGYIIDIFNNEVEIRVTQIGHKGINDIETKYRNVFYQNIDRLNHIQLHKEDILAMIDLALSMSDKEWFNKLSKQYKYIRQYDKLKVGE